MGRPSPAASMFALVVALAMACGGCGRLGFDPLVDDDGDVIGAEGPMSMSMTGVPAGPGGGSTPGEEDTTSQERGVCVDVMPSVDPRIGGAGQAIFASEDFVYLGLSEGVHAMQIIDARDPAAPVERGSFRTDAGRAALHSSRNDVLGIWVDGNHAYLATYRGGLVVVDVSDPDAPRFTGALDLPSETWAVQVRGGIAYVANHQLGLVLVDVSRPSSPAWLADTASRGDAQDVHVVGSTAFVAAKSHLHAVDVTNPRAPRLRASFQAAGMAYEVTARDEDVAWVTDKIRRRLLTIDATDPNTLSLAHETSQGDGDFRSLAVRLDRLLVGTGDDGSATLRMYDVTDPFTPVLLDVAPAPSPLYEVAVNSELVWGAAFDTGVAQPYVVGCASP